MAEPPSSDPRPPRAPSEQADVLAELQTMTKLLRRLNQNIGAIAAQMERDRALLGTIAEDNRLATDPRYRDPRHVARHLAQVSSQTTEDAIVAEMIDRVGPGAKRFLEIGVQDGRECVTRFLLEHCGWSGVWIEGSPEHCAAIRERFAVEIAEGRLGVVEAMVTAENINDLVRDAIPGLDGVDCLSLDIDMNTSHVWTALDMPARLAAIEYNASIPPAVDWEVPYDPAAVWDGTNIFGASLKALDRIGRAKAMSLVGCDPRGVSAFFVANDQDLSTFLPPFDAETHFEPARYMLNRSRRGHRRRG